MSRQKAGRQGWRAMDLFLAGMCSPPGSGHALGSCMQFGSSSSLESIERLSFWRLVCFWKMTFQMQRFLQALRWLNPTPSSVLPPSSSRSQILFGPKCLNLYKSIEFVQFLGQFFEYHDFSNSWAPKVLSAFSFPSCLGTRRRTIVCLWCALCS